MTSSYILEDSFFRTLLEAAPDAILVCDQSGIIVIANDQRRELFGFTQQELIGQPIELLVPEAYKSAHVAMRNKYFAAPHRRPMGMGLSLNAQGKDKSLVPVEISLSPAKIEDETYVVAVVRDVTELRKLDRELKKNNRELTRSNEDLERFAYVASHDLKEPLRVIASYISLVKRQYAGALGKDGQGYLDLATQSINLLQDLISDLLTYSRLSTRGQEFTDVSLIDVVEQVCANIQVLISEAQATIQIDNLPHISGDKIQLTQLFQNLLSNAIKFRHKTIAPLVTITCASKGDQWIIKVKDNGIGIPKQDQNRVFTIFQRLHGRDEYPGTGIGLAICQKVVERHHGSIAIESEPDQGTTFLISLPRQTN